MSHDPTENVRRKMVADINSNATERASLEERYGRVWTTKELGEDFEVIGFLAPFVQVRRKADGVRGTLTFQHSPRFYFSFEQE